MIQFSCLTDIPAMTKGLVRELRVRWMLEELGLPYEAIVYPHPETKKEPYLTLQPFGQVPYFKTEDLQMFESGAILLHLALKYDKFIPSEENARAITLQWMFAAQTSLEPFLFHSFMLRFDPESTDGMKERARQTCLNRLRVLSDQLGNKEFFSGSFTIAEMVMTMALRNAKSPGLLADFPNLSNYIQRMEERPAFQRALNDHLKLYKD